MKANLSRAIKKKQLTNGDLKTDTAKWVWVICFVVFFLFVHECFLFDEVPVSVALQLLQALNFISRILLVY